MSSRSTEENQEDAALLLKKQQEEDALVLRHKSSVPPFQRREAQAGVMVGAIAGAVLGAIAGPPGVAAGAAFGAAIGGVAGAALDRVDAARDKRERELDDEIGITRGNMGAYPVHIPQAPTYGDILADLESTPYLPTGDEGRVTVEATPGNLPPVDAVSADAAPIAAKTDAEGSSESGKEPVTSVDALLADIAKSVSSAPDTLSEGSMPKSAAVEKELGSLAKALVAPPAEESSPDQELFEGLWRDTQIDEPVRSSRRPSMRPSFRPSYRPSQSPLQMAAELEMTESDPFPSIVPPAPKEA
jgi:uncharacterized protein YcfJ